MIETTAYLIIQPTRRGYDGEVVGLELDRIVKNKPKLGVRDVAIKLTLRVDERLFFKPEPEITIDIVDGRAIIVPTVEIEIPSEDESTDEVEP